MTIDFKCKYCKNDTAMIQPTKKGAIYICERCGEVQKAISKKYLKKIRKDNK